MTLFSRYWGKSRRLASGDITIHLLACHNIDVAAVLWHLLDPDGAVCRRLAGALGVPPSWLQRVAAFFAALHDLGKFSRVFQSCLPQSFPFLVPPSSPMQGAPRHDTLGFLVWTDALKDRLRESGSWNPPPDAREESRLLTAMDRWMEVVTGHHGVPPASLGKPVSLYFKKEDIAAATAWVLAVWDFFLQDTPLSPLAEKSFRKKWKTVSWEMGGLVVLADWMASGIGEDRYVRDPISPAAYWEQAQETAASLCKASGIETAAPAPFTGIEALFPYIKSPTPLQEYARKVDLGDGPALFILEDVTGAGKTEAALILTHRLLAKGAGSGLYVGLPTMATANAMYHRLATSYRRLFCETARPSLILAHGARDLVDGFQESVGISGWAALGEEAGDGAFCSGWIADNRKKALLAHVGVGTVDQALLSVLPARHQSLRMAGLGTKVLVVDEVHAYDDGYMNRLLEVLLSSHGARGGSAILLSATLPAAMKQRLQQAFCDGVGREAVSVLASDYPLATKFPEGVATPIGTRESVKRRVHVRGLSDEKTVFSVIDEAVCQGKCVVWIRNTVGDAREALDALLGFSWMEKEACHLFHSRFAMADRKRIEGDLISRFGPGPGSGSDSRKGQVVVATQVVEQSIDCDWDVMISDLAPVDVLIQRAGRLCRHLRDGEGNRMAEGTADGRGEPTLYLFGPNAEDTVERDWPGDAHGRGRFVYRDTGLVWMTKRIFEQKKGFSMPEDARALMEAVYSEDLEDRIPDALVDVHEEVAGEILGRGTMAGINLLRLAKGYVRESAAGEAWADDLRIPTRLDGGMESVTVALARMDDDGVRPYVADANGGWALSLVTLPVTWWKKAEQKIPASFPPLLKTAEETWRELRFYEVFPLTQTTASFYDPAWGWRENGGEDAPVA